MKRTKWTTELQQKAELLLDSGLNKNQVSKELGVSRSTIQRHFDHNYKQWEREYHKAYAQENKAKLTKYNKKYRADNREGIKKKD